MRNTLTATCQQGENHPKGTPKQKLVDKVVATTAAVPRGFAPEAAPCHMWKSPNSYIAATGSSAGASISARDVGHDLCLQLPSVL
jgi:hypothetical protein